MGFSISGDAYQESRENIGGCYPAKGFLLIVLFQPARQDDAKYKGFRLLVVAIADMRYGLIRFGAVNIVDFDVYIEPTASSIRL